MGKSPKAPDPVATAQAQTGSDVNTALANAELNRINQYGPTGSSTYQINGYTPGPSGTRIPQYSQTTSLSPELQNLYNLGVGGQTKLANIGQGQLDNLSQTYSKPFNTDVSGLVKGAQDAAYKAQTQYLDPQYQQSEDQMRTQLINEGVQPGTEAYDKAWGNLQRAKTGAYTAAQTAAEQAGFGEQGQALQEQLALRNQPLNEYNALTTGTQVQAPNFQGVPNAQVSPTNVAGIVNQGYQNQLQQYQNNPFSLNNLFNLGGNLGSAAILAR